MTPAVAAVAVFAAPAAALSITIAVTGCSGGDGLGLGEERVAADEPAIQAELIRLTRDITLKRRDDERQPFVRRFNQSKSVACLDAQFVVGALPADLAVGLFATPRSYPAKLRLANATQFDDREKDLRGLSIKVLDVADATSVGGETGIQDFTFNNYPALFAATPKDFLSFVQATAEERTWAFFVNPLDSHFKAALILFRARGNSNSPFAEQYYSTTPSRFGGAGTAVKYSVRSCVEPARPAAADDPDFLRRAIAQTFAAGAVCLAFMVQKQTDPERMPIEDASVTWPEDLSPYRKVAEVRVPPQAFESEAQMQACEALSFNPWNGRDAHRPLGGINRVRKGLYEAAAALRASEVSSRP